MKTNSRKRTAIAALLAVLCADGASAQIGPAVVGNAAASRSRGMMTTRQNRAAGTETAAAAEKPAPKTQESCRAIVAECMDNALTAAVLEVDVLYDDYNDMVSDVYGGMKTPPFKCAYTFDGRQLFTRFYFGLSNLGPVGMGSDGMKRVEKDSIEYYNFLRQNALDVASKKLPATELNPGVLKIAGITTSVEGTKPQLPFADYRITTFDGEARFKADRKACTDMSRPELAGCDGLLEGAVPAWLRLDPSQDKSCEDYKVFLSKKLAKARDDAQLAIAPLKSRLQTIVDEHNANEAAKRKLGRN